jgi:arylsulfatase A-like enzyme
VALACGPREATGLDGRGAAGDGRRDDVLVVLLDDVGKEALAVYGAGETARTPVLDRLAREGIVYDRAYASPQCSPARALLVTGRYGFRTGFGSNSRTSPFDRGLDGPGVPDRLRAGERPDDPSAALHVAWYGKWHLVTSGTPDAERHPIAVGGFERFTGHLRNLGGDDAGDDAEEEGAHDLHHYRWLRIDADREGVRAALVDGEELGYDERSWASAVCRRALSDDLAALDARRPGRRLDP